MGLPIILGCIGEHDHFIIGVTCPVDHFEVKKPVAQTDPFGWIPRIRLGRSRIIGVEYPDSFLQVSVEFLAVPSCPGGWRSMGMPVKEGDHVVAFDQLPKSGQVFFRPIVVGSERMQVKGQSDWPARGSDDCLQVLFEKLQAIPGA